MGKNKGLGRGLEAIFIDNAVIDEDMDKGRVMSVPLVQIDPKADQPRRTFDKDSLGSLAESIAVHGVLQPILIRRTEGERYEIIAGERRFRASKLAGLSELPAIIIEADDLAAAKFALIENLQREDLNPYDEARAYSMLMGQYGLSQEEISKQIGRSRSAIANSLRLLDLPDSIVILLTDGKLTAGHCRALLALRDPAQIPIIAERCVRRGLSVRDTEAAVRALNKSHDAIHFDPATLPTDIRVDYIRDLEARFTGLTGRRCSIVSSKRKKTFQIEYRDSKDLEYILRLLGGDSLFDEESEQLGSGDGI